MSIEWRNWVLGLTVVALPGLQAIAGPVEVSYDKPAAFSDAGDNPASKERNLKALSDHLQVLGQRYLPAGQSLSVEVTDVQLAGFNSPPNAHGQRVRVSRDGANAQVPRIALRYTLKEHDQVVGQGEERLSDLGYLDHTPQMRDSDPLSAEKRMLDDWFQSHFGKG